MPVGSGNKYAIALLLKNNIDFKIFSGEEELRIETKNVKFREKEFDQILINGQETSLTTDMGPQWEPWMAIREILSNSIDEGENNVVNDAISPMGKSGYTRFYIEKVPPIQEVVDNWDHYFTFDRVDALISTDKGSIYPAPSDNRRILFRKGIRCVDREHKGHSLFLYDLPNFKINESRVAADLWDCGITAYSFLAQYATKEIASQYLNAGSQDKYWESTFYWSDHNIQGGKLCEEWREAIGNHSLILSDVAGWFSEEQQAYPHFFVKMDFAKLVKKSFPDVRIFGLTNEDGKRFKKKSHTPREEFLINKAVEFLKEGGVFINYEIQVGEFDMQTQLGGIKDNTILLSEEVFNMGLKEIVMTISEENEHLKTGFKDKTREFQNHWIKLYITEMENRIGNFL